MNTKKKNKRWYQKNALLGLSFILIMLLGPSPLGATTVEEILTRVEAEHQTGAIQDSSTRDALVNVLNQAKTANGTELNEFVEAFQNLVQALKGSSIEPAASDQLHSLAEGL